MQAWPTPLYISIIEKYAILLFLFFYHSNFARFCSFFWSNQRCMLIQAISSLCWFSLRYFCFSLLVLKLKKILTLKAKMSEDLNSQKIFSLALLHLHIRLKVDILMMVKASATGIFSVIFQEDIEIAHSLGVNAYRFSISWARILPRGRFGEVNPSGIKFYNKIIDNLLVRGIEPFVTTQHFDLPQELEDRYGSWLSPLIQEDFVLFAETCFKSFGDRVKYWITINEPNMFAEMAYVRGTYPPAHCSAPFGNCSVGNSDVEPLIVVHNMLLSHAKAVKLYREHFQPKQGGSIGLIAHSHMYEPLRDEESDRQAVSRALAFTGCWAIDPLVFGDYPPEMRQYHGSALPRFSPEETEFVKGSIDFIGLNHYSTLYAKDCIHSPCNLGGDHFIRGFTYTTGERDGILIGELTGVERFYVVPRGMEKIVDYVSKRYNNMPIYVTENGYSPPQTEQASDFLHDVARIKFHKGYLSALARAIRNGANVRGYFVWSLIDNFEWAGGYSSTFGLYYVDRQTLKRTPKLSVKWYEDFLTNRSRGSNKEGFKNGNEGSQHSRKGKNIIIARTEGDQNITY